tara:strand:- start:452 stop:1405 length:954 start_codon:yes stop_codon:yes gene_type:complete
MATFTTSNAVGEREQLADIIYRLDTSETPIFSAVEKITTNGVFYEWQVQELAAAATDNHVNEGADASFATPTATSRLGNYHQISVKDFAISGTLESVDKAGRERESAYQTVLKGLELRRDIEKSVGDTNVARSASDPRKSASLLTWITNISAPSDMGAATGDGTDTADVTGTARALTLAQIEAANQAAWEDGGSPKILVCSATNKANISNLSAAGTNLVTNQVNATAGTAPSFVGAVSVFLTDFGELQLTPSRFMSNDKLFVIDPEYVSIGTLNGRNFAESELSKTGDAEKTQIVTEYTLVVKAPKAHGAVIGLNGS